MKKKDCHFEHFYRYMDGKEKVLAYLTEVFWSKE